MTRGIMLYPSISEFSASLPEYRRIIGLDVGTTTIGIALSDISRMIASPMETIHRTKFSKDMERLKAIIAEHHVAGLVIGWPVNMDGSEGPRCQSTKQFARNVEAQLSLPSVMWDERMSSMAVDKAMLEADLSRQKRDKHIDKLAASYILQGALEAMRTPIIRADKYDY
jgi:putative Holliday junction resolvase